MTTMRPSWRDVPMPPQIAALPRDPRGFPITHIVMRYPILLPPTIDPVLGIVADEDITGPEVFQFGLMSEQRQRDCFFNMRCQVCYADLRKKRRYVAGGLDDRDLDDFLFREPYVCHSCLGYALQVCPGLVTGTRKEELRVVRVASNPILYAERIDADHTPRIYRIGYDLTTACFYLRAQFQDGTVMTPEKFLEDWRAS